jgi:adenylate kinase
MLNLVFLGPPGAGKGTQARTMASKRGLAHVSTGDLFREAVRARTELGEKAQAYLDDGLLVPDKIVCDMVRERLGSPDAEKGFILDGFPRTSGQAERLDEDLAEMGRKLTAAVDFELEDAEALLRLGGRLTCSGCGAMYHESHNPPATKGICDKCGEQVAVRDDDRPETIRRRLQEYREKTAPLAAYYAERDLLRRIPACGTINEIEAVLERLLGDR